MKKKVFVLSVMVFAVLGTFLWFFVRDKVTADVTPEWSEQEYVITTVDTDVEGLSVEASITYSEVNSHPILKISYVNNGREDMHPRDTRIYSINEGDWIDAPYDRPIDHFLSGAVILCPQMVGIGNALSEGGEPVTNTLSRGYYPWVEYSALDSLGEYRFEIDVYGKDTDTKLGIVWVEWTQKLK